MKRKREDKVDTTLRLLLSVSKGKEFSKIQASLLILKK